MGVQIAQCKGAIFWGKDTSADLSLLAAANALVRGRRCGGIITRGGRVHSSLRGVAEAGDYDSTIRVQQ